MNTFALMIALKERLERRGMWFAFAPATCSEVSPGVTEMSPST
ncbi:hypothetical protein [Nonomuraea gerenzanensis]|nr:hypothetical protein [Nonomuraea gerenzanensis]